MNLETLKAELPSSYGDLIKGYAVAQKFGQINHKALELEAQGWREWYREIFGDQFIEAFGEGHHAEALEWHWDSRMAFFRGEKPKYFAYFPIWARGNGKTTLLRALILCDACISHSANQPSYALIVGGTKKKAKGTAVTISQMLALPKIKEYYPALSRVQKTDQGQSQGWTADFIYTEANAVFNFIGLDEGVAGTNVADIRPTLIAPDDIDDREDSPVISESRFQTFTRAVLPTRQHNTIVFFAQNLISRYSTMYRIHKQHVRVLTNRKPTDPIPAVMGLETEERVVDGIIKDIVIAGTPTWKKWSLDRIQEEIDTYGLPAFNRECQHEVEQSKEGLIIHTYDDVVHPISYSELASVYGRPDVWKDWYKVPFNDWSRTKTAKHANVAGYVCVSSQNTALPGFTYFVPLSFPENRLPEDVAVKLLSTLTPYAYDQVTWADLVQESFQRANVGQHFSNLADKLAYERAYLKNVIQQYSVPVLNRYHVKAGAMSHSEDKVRENFNQIFGFGFQPANPKQTDAVEDIVRAFKVNYDEDHPFREGVKGYARTFILCPDDTNREPQLINDIWVYPPAPYPNAMVPDSLHDADLMRYQLSNWRWADPKLTETGERVDAVLKLNDDFGQALQMVYFLNLLNNIPLTDLEKFEEKMSAKGLPKEIYETEDLGLIQRRIVEERAFTQKKSESKKASMPWRRR